MKLTILMNGPSLIETYKKIDTSSDVLGCNHFADHELYQRLKPDFYMFIDPYFWRDDVREVLKSNRTKTFKILKASYPKKYIVQNPEAKNYLSNLGGAFSKSQYEVLKWRYSIAGKNIYDYVSFSNPIVRLLNQIGFLTISPSNVAFGALHWAKLKKYSEIDLHGCDFSIFKNLTVDQGNRLCLHFEHFYGESDELVFRNKKTDELQKVEDELLKWRRFFIYMNELAKQLERADQRVINFSKSSMLQCFERSDD